jgi:RHS repeat-associated protein
MRDPYGNLLSGVGAEDFQYKGEQFDPNTSLTYMRARYYDPGIGRFISRDPIEGDLMNPQTQNGYNFTNGDPVNFSDPSGKDAFGICGCISGGVGVAGSYSNCSVSTPQGTGKAKSTSIGGSTFDIVSGGGSVYYNWDSNVKKPSDLNGTSSQLGFWVGPVDVSFEKNLETNNITAVEVGLNGGISLPVGIHGGKSETIVIGSAW